MSLDERLLELAQQRIELWVEHGQLRIRAPKGALTAPLREELAAQKDQIIALLQHGPRPGVPQIDSEQGTVVGPVPLTPAQYTFLYARPNPRTALGGPRPIHFDVTGSVDPTALGEAVRQLAIHHDALRMRFLEENGTWRQFNLAAEEHDIFTHVDVGRMSPEEQWAAINSVVRETKLGIDISTGPLLRAVLFSRGAENPSHFVLVVHHLVLDVSSASILHTDLEAAYEQLSQGQPARLPPKTSSFKAWAERLTEYSRSQTLLEERDYWLSLPWNVAARPRADFSNYRGTKARECVVSLSLTADETRTLLFAVPDRCGCNSIDALVMALSRAHTSWTGGALLLDLYHHGREPIFDDLDVARTVGWFTTSYPVIIDLSQAAQPLATLMSVHEALASVPKGGMGYAILHCLTQDPDIVRLPRARVALNYQSQIRDMRARQPLFRLSDHTLRLDHQVSAKRHLEWTSFVQGGALQVQLVYTDAVYRSETMERLAATVLQSLRALVAAVHADR